MNPVRRLAAPLREMRWGQVVVEFALLIAGILAALAVDGWMDDRRDARLERQYLELLTRPEHAIFISYAREDLPAVQRFTTTRELAERIAAARASSGS